MLFNFLDMMFHILGDPEEDFGSKGKSKRAEKKWCEETSVLTFLWPHKLPPGPRGWIFHYRLVTIVQPLPPVPEFIEEPSRPSLLPSLFG